MQPFSIIFVQKSSKSMKASGQLLSSMCRHDMTWSAKGFGGHSLSIIRSFYRQRALMTF
jgi:hypothetical protein